MAFFWSKRALAIITSVQLPTSGAPADLTLRRLHQFDLFLQMIFRRSEIDRVLFRDLRPGSTLLPAAQLETLVLDAAKAEGLELFLKTSSGIFVTKRLAVAKEHGARVMFGRFDAWSGALQTNWGLYLDC